QALSKSAKNFTAANASSHQKRCLPSAIGQFLEYCGKPCEQVIPQVVEGGGSSFIELPKPIYRNASALLVTVTDWAEYREPSNVATILTSVPTPKRLVASVREGSK